MGCGKSKSEDEPSESDKQSLTEGAKDGKSKKSGASDEKTPQGDQTTSRIQSTDVIDMVMQGIYGDDPAGGKEPGEIAANDTDGLEARGQAPELSPIVEETENDRSSTEDTTSKALPKVKKLVNAAEADEEHDLITAEIFRGAQMSGGIILRTRNAVEAGDGIVGCGLSGSKECDCCFNSKFTARFGYESYRFVLLMLW
eukprot:CAMPEP_0169087720 /NCGR_PEP_ID=MMETSP1015-20121227/14378_1 /TAXON_ID=342587 /ORGANISM="Karlodinium micrum, Strain CCMP2283" /LENGTH=198 /DNA_ID=CAMNT_0009147961 /DNA_START=61 /DNA_END=654 /DNA_ORIENTATION=-